MALNPQRIMVGEEDQATKELMRLILERQRQDTGGPRRRPSAPPPAPKPFLPDVRTSTNAAWKVQRLMGLASEPGLEVAPGRGILDVEPPPMRFRPGDYTTEPLGAKPDQPPTPFAVPGPIRVPVDEGAPEPVLSSTDYANRAVDSMEDVAKKMPQGNYSNATVTPELGIDHLNRTGKVLAAGEKPAGVTTGVTFRDKNPELPPVRIPTLTDAALSDSVVQLPYVPEDMPKRVVDDPSVRTLTREPGESDTAYSARKHRAYQDALRTESPNSKVKETAAGVSVEPPVKPGLKQRALGGLLLALANLGAGSRHGAAGAAGSSVASLLASILAPDLVPSMKRQAQRQVADDEGKTLDEQQSRDFMAAERKARTEQLNDYPRRQADEERDKRYQRREQQMRLLVASPEGFDPQHNQEHRKLQQEALADGQILPAIPPKPGRATNATPHTSARAVTAGEYPGLKPGTKIRQIWNGSEFEDDVQNGKPVITNEPTDKPETPDVRGDLRSQLASVQSEIANSQSEWDRHNGYVQQKQRQWQTEAAKRKAAAQAADPTGQTLEAKRSLKEWADQVRDEDPEYVQGNIDTSTTSRDYLANDLKEKKAAEKELRRQLEQEDRRPRKAAYASDSFTPAQVQAWATARGISLRKARRMLEKEGATIQ